MITKLILTAGVVMTLTVSGLYDRIPFMPVSEHTKVPNTKQDFEKSVRQKKASALELKNKVPADERILTTFTFAKALSEQEVQKLVDLYELELTHVYSRFIDGQGLRATSVNRVKGTPYVDKAFIDDQIKRLGGEYKGIIEANGYIKAGMLEKAAQEKLIYVADIDGDPKVTYNPKKKFPVGQYWNLEDYKLTLAE
ncbi:hypothetical protein [Paenibacillus sp. FJAT-26967]|uniref:hypothetical protein n=1 Tax=Paenibacillus sp. FJAT-26967 TaxID=1729690 RepID=UPI000837DEC9|nr:hypothetical protein [Paenibacillus sp. FJAT-26967]